MRFLALLIACLAVRAQNTESAAKKYFTDTVLVDQNGVERRFYSDLIKDRIVIINAMFAGCKGSCPMMAKTFARIQDELGSKLDKQVVMLSISVDPQNDTPAVLNAYAQQSKAKPGWYFLTGKKTDVETVLKRLGLYVERREEHLNIFLMGNDRTGLWKKVFGMSPAQETIATLKSVLQDAQ